jgi:hypothetical protein
VRVSIGWLDWVSGCPLGGTGLLSKRMIGFDARYAGMAEHQGRWSGSLSASVSPTSSGRVLAFPLAGSEVRRHDGGGGARLRMLEAGVPRGFPDLRSPFASLPEGSRDAEPGNQLSGGWCGVQAFRFSLPPGPPHNRKTS